MAWSPDSKLIVVQGFSAYSLYRVALLGDHTLVEMAWQPTSLTSSLRVGESTFSPDSRYYFVQGKVVDTYTSWPVFQFRNSYYREYRWEGDTLIGVNPSTETTHGVEVYYHTSDFLPE